MNKNDLVQKLAERTGLSKMDAQKAVDGVFELITDSLKSGEGFVLPASASLWFQRERAAKDAILRPAKKSPSKHPRQRASAPASR